MRTGGGAVDEYLLSFSSDEADELFDQEYWVDKWDWYSSNYDRAVSAGIPIGYSFDRAMNELANRFDEEYLIPS